MLLTDQDKLSCLTSTVLQLILMPTERCNYRCTYCFEDFSQGRMEPWVVEAVKRFLRRRADGLCLLSLDWFGGEPLLAGDVVEEVQEYAMALSRKRPKLRLRGSMTTNAHLLTVERFSRLLSRGVRRFQISLDGIREVHDTMRLTAGGRGTFDRIWANLLAARRSEETFQIVVRFQLHDVGRSHAAEFLDLYEQTFGTDDRFELATVPVNSLVRSTDSGVGEGRAGRAAEASLRNAEARGLKLRVTGPGPVICYASRANSFIVRSDGTLAKCTYRLYRPENCVGRLLKDGRVELDASKMAWFMRGLESSDERELSCPMRGHAERGREHGGGKAAGTVKSRPRVESETPI